jgi:hypothetical protein
MNATMINNREYVENLHGMESNINLRLLVQIWIIFINSLTYSMKNLRLLVAVFVSAVIIIMIMSCGSGKHACDAYGQVDTEERI